MCGFTLWKLRLSSKGTKTPNQLVLFLSHVMVFLHTGNRIKAMFSFNVSAAPLAKHTQGPKTSYTALFLYWIYLYAKRMAIIASHNAITQILCQLSSTKNLSWRYHLLKWLGSRVGLRLSLSISLSSFLSSLLVVLKDFVSACRSNFLRLSICFKFTTKVTNRSNIKKKISVFRPSSS